MGDVKETSYIHTAEDSYGVITTNERRQITQIMRLKGTHPDEVEIMHQPEDNYGVLVAKVPKTWFKVNPPRKYTEEQRKAMGERFKAKNHPCTGEETT